MNSDDDYRPEEDPDDSDPDDNEEGDVGLELLGQDFDEEAYLRGSFSGDEEEDEDEEEGGQRSIFAEGQDPLSVLEGMGREDPSGRQPFELLAAANRRQLRGARGGAVKEGAVKQGAQQQVGGEGVDDDGDAPGPSNRAAVFGASVEDIWNDPLAEKLGLNPTSGRKKRRAKDRRKRLAAKKGVKSRELPEEVTKKLGEANLLYAMQKHEEAIALLLEVVRLAPNLSDPYHTLGLLHEAVGNSKKALDFYMIAAHITPKDVPLWKRLAQMSSEHGLLRQAVYCLSQVIKRDKEDLEARYDRALLYAELEDDRKAIDGFEQILAVRPSHPEVPKALARLHHRVGQQGKAVAVVERHIQQHPQATDLTHVNILAELYGEAGRWEEVLALVRRAEAEFCGGEGEDEGEGGLPVDLQVKAGIALCHLDRPDEAAQLLSCLLGEPVDQFADLYADAGSILQGVGRPEAALPYFRCLPPPPPSVAPAPGPAELTCAGAGGAAGGGWRRGVGAHGHVPPGHGGRGWGAARLPGPGATAGPRAPRVRGGHAGGGGAAPGAGAAAGGRQGSGRPGGSAAVPGDAAGGALRGGGGAAAAHICTAGLREARCLLGPCAPRAGQHAACAGAGVGWRGHGSRAPPAAAVHWADGAEARPGGGGGDCAGVQEARQEEEARAGA